jgi:hypothetical protein
MKSLGEHERGKKRKEKKRKEKNSYVLRDVTKVKVKFTLEQAMKAQRWSRCITLLFLQPRH